MAEIAQGPAGGSRPAPADEFGAATRECDLVMKGGVASGVVYPSAVLALARDYRFRSIGGTSAGAIAAAGVAAAEYGRATGGFGRLAALGAELRRIDPHTGQTVLAGLFQPAPGMAPLFRVLLDLAGTGAAPAARGRRARLSPWVIAFRTLLALLRHTPLACALGALAGIAAALLLTALVGGTLLGPGALIVALACGVGGGAASGLVYLLYGIAWRRLGDPRSFFGLCTGHEPGGGERALTDWLHARLNELAGLPADGPPLTFGQLRARGRRELAPLDPRYLPEPLRMVTTDVSDGRPIVFPAPDDERFLFGEAEFRRLFPAAVIDHLIAHRAAPAQEGEPPDGYHFLPPGDDLPVVVATRLSLSFPILLGAVPLYRLEKGGGTAPADLRRHWFSDGGLSSNFPIQMFDAWRPTRPTFGIKLYYDGKEGPRKRADRRGATDPIEPDVRLPDPRDELRPDWADVRDLPGFLAAIVETVRNYRDNTQSLLPSYRERIVQIHFAEGEGGLNLAMDEPTFERIEEKGARAGALLRDFGERGFEQHQWVRFRVLMAQLEHELRRMKRGAAREAARAAALGLGNPPLPDDPPADLSPEGRLLWAKYRRLLLDQAATAAADEHDHPSPPPDAWYKAEGDRAWLVAAGRRVEELLRLIDGWDEEFFVVDQPAPPPTLRITTDL